MAQFGKTARAPVWRTRSRVVLRHVPAHLRGWLFFSGSLTQRLIDACDGDFAVRVLAQGHARPLFDEQRALGVAATQQSFVRQVHLLCGDTPWVYARTVIPWRTLSGRRRRLTRLGGRSLGQVLFTDPGMAREPMEVACLHPEQALFQVATQGMARAPSHIWGRRSIFRLDGRPLLVSEFFLPELMSSRTTG